MGAFSNRKACIFRMHIFFAFFLFKRDIFMKRNFHAIYNIWQGCPPGISFNNALRTVGRHGEFGGKSLFQDHHIMNQTSCCIPFCTVWALFHEDCSSGFEMAMFFSRLITVLKENKSQNSYHFVIIWYLTGYGFGLLTHKMIST